MKERFFSRLAVTMFLSGFTFLLVGQAEKTFSPNVLQKFTDTYTAANKLKPNKEAQLAMLLEATGISEKEYKAQFLGRPRSSSDMTTENGALFIKISQAQDSIQNVLEEQSSIVLNNLCKRKKITRSQFDAINRKYQSDIEFQKKLKPFFDKTKAKTQDR